MLVTIIPSIRQIRKYAESALNGFEDLSTGNAIENARCELQSLLTYLDRLQETDDSVCEPFISGIKSRVKVELLIRNLDG